MKTPTGGDAPTGAQRPRKTLLAPLPQFGGAAAGGTPAPAEPPAAAAPPPVAEEAGERPVTAVATDAAEGRTNLPAVIEDASPPAPAPGGRRRVARTGDDTIPRIARGRPRRDAPAPGEKPERRLPVYVWFHNVRFLRELKLEMEARGARPGDTNDSLFVRAALTALERAGMDRILRVCRNEDQMVRAMVARLEGASEAEVLRMIAKLIAGGEGDAGA